VRYIKNCLFLYVYVQGLHYITVQNTGVKAEPFLSAHIYKHFFTAS